MALIIGIIHDSYATSLIALTLKRISYLEGMKPANRIMYFPTH
jgi:hypothetical protein